MYQTKFADKLLTERLKNVDTMLDEVVQINAVDSRVEEILRILDINYPYDGVCFLTYNEPWQLLFATILSAQCTDNMVNKVTAELYKEFACLDDFANCDISDLEEAVRPTGFYRTKAANLKAAAIKLLEDFSGVLPSDIESLTSLAGVGRKTANVVRGHIFGIPSIVVDTHVKRVSLRLGITKEKDPVKIEFELMERLPKERWIAYNQQVISHGRKVCASQRPKCKVCELESLCAADNYKMLERRSM